jgi:hypothetical protein
MLFYGAVFEQVLFNPLQQLHTQLVVLPGNPLPPSLDET